MLGGLETNSWPGSHLAYWPKHIHEGRISSTDSLFFSFIFLSLLLCQPSTMSSLTYRQRTKTNTNQSEVEGACEAGFLGNIVCSLLLLPPHPMSWSSWAVAAAADSHNPNRSICVLPQKPCFLFQIRHKKRFPPLGSKVQVTFFTLDRPSLPLHIILCFPALHGGEKNLQHVIVLSVFSACHRRHN